MPTDATTKQTKLWQTLRIGFVTFLLTSALFSIPLLSSHQNFAHTHPDGISFHYHALNTLFPGLTVAVITTLSSWVLAFTIAYQHTARIYKRVFNPANPVRAPPVTNVFLSA